VLGSLPSAIKRNPLAPFYRFSPLPRSPVVPSHLPAVVPSPVPPAVFSRPCRRVSTPASCAVASSSVAAASSPPAFPLFPAKTSGSASPPATVALPPLFRLRPPLPRPLCAGRRRHHLSRHRNAILFPGQATASPVFRRNAVARAASPSVSSAPTPAAPFAVPVRRPTSPSPPPASQRQGRPRPRLPFDRTPPRSILVISIRSRRRRPVGRPARRLAAPPPSSASQWRVPRHPRLRAAAVGCPRRLLAGPGRRRRRPLVVPGCRGVRPSVKPFSFVVLASSSAAAPSSSSSSPPRRQASCRPCLAFVQGSPLKSFPCHPSPPRPFVVVFPTPRRVVVRISPLAAPSSSFRCRPVPVVRLSTPVPVYRCR
jgi:hypothetical protein